MHQSLAIVRDVAQVAIGFGLPILAVLPRVKNGNRDLRKRMVISTLVTWAALVLHYWFIGLPVARGIAEARGDRFHEAEAALASQTILFYGWIPAVIGTAVVAGGYFLFQYVRERRHSAAS
jgi:hypothetical protein